VIVQLQHVAYDPRVRGLCLRPYPGHPRGCPNFKLKAGCPPYAPLLDAVLCGASPVWAIINEFDLAAHVARLRARHPGWSDRQLRCCLYWQGTARRQLEAAIAAFKAAHPECVVARCPEALGVDVTATLRAAGVDLEWPPVRIVRQVALAGVAAAAGAARSAEVT